MPTTLHIIDPRGDGEPMLPALARHLRRGDDAVAVIGAAAAPEARAAGLARFHRLSPALARAECAGPALRALARRLGASTLVAWSPAAAVAASLAAVGTRADVCAVVAVRPDRCSRLARARVRALARHGRIVFVGPSMRDQWLAADHNPAVPEAPCCPGPVAPRRAATRSAWGVDRTPVVGLLDADGAGGPAVDAFFAAFIGGMLEMTGRDIAFVAPRGARGLERGKRLMQRHGGRWCVLPERRPAWSWLPGVDALFTFGAEGLAHGWAAQLGVPVVSIGPDHDLDESRLTTRRPREATARLLEILDTLDLSASPDTRDARGDLDAALRVVGAPGPLRASPPARPALSP